MMVCGIALQPKKKWKNKTGSLKNMKRGLSNIKERFLTLLGRDCVVTPEITSEYWAKMQASMDEFGYKDGESCGTIPTTLNKDGIKYELIQYSSHGFTCDEPMCQAMFQAADENDGGMAAAFVYTRLPIYTCRETVGETHEFLVSDTETKKGYS